MNSEEIGWVIGVCMGSFLVPFFVALIFARGKDKWATAVTCGLLFGGGFAWKHINEHFHPIPKSSYDFAAPDSAFKP